MDRVINLKLLSHPANWGIVWTTLLFGGVAWTLIHKTIAGHAPASTQGN